MQKTQNFQTSVAKSYQYLPTIFFFTLYYGLCELKKKTPQKPHFSVQLDFDAFIYSCYVRNVL